VSAANYKTAMIGDIANRTNGSFNLDSFIYTNLIDAGDNRVFDTIRSSEFIKSILSLNEIPYSTRLPLDDVNIAPVSNYYILFVGAGNSERQWPINYFVKVAEYVLSLQPECVPIICGGKEDEQMSNQFESSFKGNVYNFVGKTSLHELVKLSSKATFLLSVDTGALHIGVASGTKVIGLFSGKFYGRFGPYPRNITTSCWCIYPDFVDKLISDKNDVLYDTTIMKNDTIKMIPPEKVLPYINKALNG
jgi:ADP-heptose:LPS heptosyltransferase